MEFLLLLVQQSGISLFGLWMSVLSPWLLSLVGLCLGIWVYRDAQKRGMDRVLWLVIVAVANIPGLLFYLVVRKPIVT
ncbi:hypothetical protein MUP77_18200 [Candidatus Bathyarchaeota archaeon]|nr:hypothetical protein [Candidatus Bathyarchaeota archaeon]